MSLYTLLLIAITIAIFYIWKKINDIQREFNEKIAPVKYAVKHPKNVAASLGAAAADTALEEVKEFTKPRPKRKRK